MRTSWLEALTEYLCMDRNRLAGTSTEGSVFPPEIAAILFVWDLDGRALSMMAGFESTVDFTLHDLTK